MTHTMSYNFKLKNVKIKKRKLFFEKRPEVEYQQKRKVF